jgi:hypothetical protein
MHLVLRNLRHLAHVTENGFNVLTGRRFGFIVGHVADQFVGGFDRSSAFASVPMKRRRSQTFCILFRRALLIRTRSVQVGVASI